MLDIGNVNLLLTSKLITYHNPLKFSSFSMN